MRALRLAFAAWLAASAVCAQAVQQSGPVTYFHVPSWFSNGTVQDGGSTSSPYVSTLGLFNGPSCPFGVSSSTGPGASLSGYGLFTICQTATTTTLTVAGVNGQATPALYFNIGGTLYPFPGAGNGTVVGPNVATIGDLACWSSTSGTILGDCGTSPVAANPTATIGLTATNGSAATFMRSDAAPALSQAISPTWTGTHTFTNSQVRLLGSSTGYTNFTSANASASNYTTTIPAATDTLVELTQAQTLTNKTIAYASNTLTGVAPLASPALTGTPTSPTGSAGDTSTQIATDAFVANATPSASTSTAGLTALATGTQVIAGTDTTHAVTPASLASSQSLGTSGYATLPGGLIIEWGNSPSIAQNASATITLPKTCASAFYVATITASANPGSGGEAYAYVSSPTTSNFVITNAAYNSITFYWQVICK